MAEVEEMITALNQLGYRVITPREEPPVECAVCGWTEELIDFRVIVADGEEGYGDVLQYRCSEHCIEVLDGLKGLGFVTHEHGSTALLEDTSCVGSTQYGSCPTPSYYGQVILIKDGFWQSKDVR